MALGTDRESIRKEAEEAEAELLKIKAENDQKEADRLAEVKELPVGSVAIEDIFSAEGDTTIPSGSGIEVKTDDATPAATAVTDTEAAALKAENTRLQSELAKLNARFESTFGNFNKAGMAELQKKVDDLENKLAAATAAPAAVPEVFTTNREEMVKDLGEPAVKVIEFLQGKITSLETALTDVTGQVKATGEKAGKLEEGQTAIATRSYYSALDSLAPDWRKINGDDKTPQNPKFLTFLDKQIPGTDMTYDYAIKVYHERGNAVKVAEIFNLFKASEGAVTTAAAGGDKEEIIPEPGKTGRGSTLPKQKTEKRTYTQAEIDRFDTLKKAGKLKATQAQIDAIESDIQDAILEGRVR
jgi:hypothetical protein